MGNLDHDPRPERLRRLSGDETRTKDPGRTTALAPKRIEAGGTVGKRTLAQSWGAELESAPRAADPAACMAARESAHRHMDALRAANAAGDYYASSGTAQQLRLAIETAQSTAARDQKAELEQLVADATPLLAAAFVPSRAASDEALAGTGDRTVWDRDVTAWREARERAWTAVAAPFASLLGVDATICVDDAAAAHGARGLAQGGVVHLSPSLVPDRRDALHILAHELVHVAQSRLPKVGALADAEHEANYLAAGIVGGQLLHQPRIGLTAGVAAADTGAASPKPAGAEMYLSVQQTDLWHAVATHLAGVPWADPASHAAWTGPSKFVAATMRSLEHLVDLDKPGQLDEMLYPAKATGVIQPLLPPKMEVWVPAIGRAIGELFEDAIVASLRRLAPRWVSIAEHEPDPDGKRDETKSLVRYDQLIKSAPIDRAVAIGLTTGGVLALVGATTTASLAANRPRGLRRVELKWQGYNDAKLWNWVKASPEDASAEEVAASLMTGMHGESNSYLAYGITDARPLFGLPPSWARRFPEAAMFAPASDAGETQSTRYLALGSSWVGTALAHGQGDARTPPKAATAAQLAKTLADAAIQAHYLIAALSPWNQAAGARGLMTWLATQQQKVAAMDAAALGTWQQVCEGQKSRLATIAEGVAQVVASARKMGVSPATPGAGSLAEILETYSRAAAVSHLGALSEQLIATAAAQQQHLAVSILRATANETSVAVDIARSVGAEDTRHELWDGASEVEESSLAVQSKLAAGQQVDEAELDELTLRAREVRFDARTKALVKQTDDLIQAARDASDGWASWVAKHIHGSFSELKAALYLIQNEVGVIDLTWRDPEEKFKAEDTDPADRARRLRAVRHGQLKIGEDAVDRIRNNAELMQFVKDGVSIIKWQRFAAGCVNLLALLALSAISGGAAGAVGEGVGGLMTGAYAAEGVTELSLGSQLLVSGTRLAAEVATETSVNTAGQLAIQGGDVGETFTENLLQAGGGKVFAKLAKDLGLAAELDKKTSAIWQRPGFAGKAERVATEVLKEGVAIPLHTVQGAALGFAAHIIATRKVQPQAMEMQDWLLQGAAVALGRHAHDLVIGRAPVHKQLELVNELHAGDLTQLDGRLLALADRAQKEPRATDAVDILEQRKDVLAREVEVLDMLERDQALQAKAQLDWAEVALWKHDVQRAQGEVAGAGIGQIAIEASGMDALVPDRVYEGSAAQLDTLETAAKRMGLEAKAARQADGTYEVSLDGKTFTVHVTEGGIAGGERESRTDPHERVTQRIEAQQPDTIEREARVEGRATYEIAATKEEQQLARIRTGKSGTLRDSTQLSSADVVHSINAQLENLKTGDIDAIVARFPPAQQERARIVLARSSGFGTMESLNDLRMAIEPHLKAGAKLYTPGRGSLADNMIYLDVEKHSFDKPMPHAIAPTASRVIEPGTIVILDDVVLAQISDSVTGKEFANTLAANKAVLLQPRGFTGGNTMYGARTPDAIARQTRTLLARAQAVQAAEPAVQFDTAVTRALDEQASRALEASGDPAIAQALKNQLEVVDPTALRPGAPLDTSSDAIASRLNSSGGITEAQLEGILARVGESDRPYLRELLAQQAEVYSPRRQGNALARQASAISSLAAKQGITDSKIYYFIPKANKSYGMVAMAHRQATETPVQQYIEGPTELAARIASGELGPDTMVVVLDDVAGSGDSLVTATQITKSNGFRGKIAISPIVTTGVAERVFNGDPLTHDTGLAQRDPNITFVPGSVAEALKDTAFYRGLTAPEREHLLDLIGHDPSGKVNALGFDYNGLSMAFPYMAPDNNNRFFGAELAEEFVINKNDNDDAVKTWGSWSPKQGGMP